MRSYKVGLSLRSLVPMTRIARRGDRPVNEVSAAFRRAQRGGTSSLNFRANQLELKATTLIPVNSKALFELLRKNQYRAELFARIR